MPAAPSRRPSSGGIVIDAATITRREQSGWTLGSILALCRRQFTRCELNNPARRNSAPNCPCGWPWGQVAGWRRIQARALLPAHIHEPRPQHGFGFGQGPFLQRGRKAGGLIDRTVRATRETVGAASAVGDVHTAAHARMRASEYVVRWRTNANPEALLVRRVDMMSPYPSNGARFVCRATPRADARPSSTPVRW